jgi:hypothetical protein
MTACSAASALIASMPVQALATRYLLTDASKPPGAHIKIGDPELWVL